MDPTACSGETGNDVPAQKTEQPQDYKNDDNSPQHKISPFG
jgi:hypothetical protein